MATTNTTRPKARTYGRLVLVGYLAVLLGLFPPVTTLAAPPEPGHAGPEQCSLCHSTETAAWQNSPHAQALADIEESLQLACAEEEESADCDCLSCHTTDFDPVERTYDYGGVSCEACHGVYVEGHPKEGVMNLDADSSVCSDCHAETYKQWQESPHAQADVQCIGCHQSHSQDFRLVDEALCGACHRDRLESFTHTAHESAEVNCTDCHLSSGPVPEAGALASARQFTSPAQVPSHSFSVVSSQACVSCHAQTIHEVVPCEDLTQQANAELLATANRVPDLTAKLKASEKAVKNLRVMTLVSLGWGIGIGGIMGVFFVLIVNYASQGRKKQ